MDELDKGQSIALTGPAREEVLRRCREIVRQWGVALPPVEPLVLDFGLGEFDKTGLVEFWIANEIEAGYCGKYMFVFDGQTCPMHQHRQKMETFFVVKGGVSIVMDGERRELRPGDVLPVPVGHKHSFTGLGHALLLELSKPCIIADNVFEDRRIRVSAR
ncbi:MAG: D-lyxose/D-mannose family sugar isomerase [Kiritimatiellae bacterium]|nr:D-lyxose/D-mannose family sugar isomerase [Kiritimatiellia bacterium]